MSQINEEIIKQHKLTAQEYENILKILGREPNLNELGIFPVMWSEHCSYKSSRRFLKNFPTTGPQVLQGPGENAGVVDIGDGLALCFKMESHNHPSFIEPYQGAATGVGGILRDVFTMGARPIANLNSLRFGNPKHPKTSHLVSGVVAGIAGYGNCMGIPTVGGEIYFDDCYNGNILVNAMTVGLIKSDRIFKGFATGTGNPVIYVGSKTGRDGIHGATMASDSFDESADQKRPTVQVGDPFTEKRLLEACLELMERDVIIGIQDMGAAGLTSSSFEMASRAGTGLELYLDQIPLREEGMTPYEMLLSESQERMLMVTKQGAEGIVKEVFEKWDLDACVVGKVTDDGFYKAFFKGEKVVDLPVAPLADAAPVYDRPRSRPKDLDALQKLDLESIEQPKDLTKVLKALISHPTMASKKWVYRQYDHQVMTNTAVLPGSDAAVVRIKGTQKAAAMTTNVNSRYCYLDPKMGGAIAVAESGRNLVCSGATPLALTDCLNFGNPEKPEIMWQFEQAVEGISDACRFFEVPVVSGNVSLYNETNTTSIFPTPTIGMVGLIKDVSKKMDSFFKNDGDVIFLLGKTNDELGGSEYLNIIHGLTKGRPPQLDMKTEKALWNLTLQLIDNGLIESAHDLSEGGLACALAESAIGLAPKGIQIKLPDFTRADVCLFSESQSRILVSVKPSLVKSFLDKVSQSDVPVFELGVIGGNQFTVSTNKGVALLDCRISDLKEAWSTGFESGIFS